ncbi:MarR family transcriptional regulator [Sagittula sp. NFXS13]|uniref:MarR family winged helix-turn-helix transcriptional regulator n=1 Tax=Sagittula sp. NFXS13 TaxID=2819095 RepID=UPI0032DE5D49
MLWQRGLNARLKPFGLTQPQFAILAVCGWMARDGQDVTQRAVVDFLGMDRMHVSQIAMRLERDKLIERSASKADQRSKLVELTTLGHERLTDVVPVVEAYDQAFFAAKEVR